MDETELQRLNNAIYTRHQGMAHTRWLEKKVIEMYRKGLKETAARLQAEQEAG